MKLYISCDHKHQEYANELRTMIEVWGHEIVTADTKADDELLKSCDIVIGLMSKDVLANMAVYSEWNWTIVYQHEHDTRLLLMRVDDCIIPEHYAHIPRIDVHTSGKDAASKSLQDALTNPETKIPKYAKVADDFETYLKRLYTETVKELEFLILPVGDNAQPIHMPRTYRNVTTQSTLSTFEQGFISHKHRAFLTGNPGVGKTITLLMKVRDAILERLQNSDAPLPILGYVVTWKALENQPLNIWLAKSTRIKAAKLQEIFKNEKCLFLFDGIDDMGSSRGNNANVFDPRARFLEQIQKLPNQHHILLTCRTEAYNDIKSKSQIQGAIELETLSDEQIETHLKIHANGVEAWEHVRKIDALKTLLRLPLMLGIFCYAYHDSVQAIEALENLTGGSLRDAIFDRYITRRYKLAQNGYHAKHEQPPFMLEEIYHMLGNVAKHGAIKYGTGEVAFVTPEDERYGYWIAVEDMSFGFVGDDNVLADEFVRFAEELHVIHVRQSGTCTFTHRLMRNYFVTKFCIPVTQKIDSYAVEALSKIPDDRVPTVLLEIMKGNFAEGIQRSAQLAYQEITGHRLVGN